ncbi:MAG: hypothetical protein Q8O67_28960 [Deltaproteobacteria bacterium]|nr:hypothetical protein [Deltaproteobacteria bacterium]
MPLLLSILGACAGRLPVDDQDAGLNEALDAGEAAPDAGASDQDAGVVDVVDAGDAGTADAGVEDPDAGFLLDSDPPPGSRCGRDWSTFDPGDVYVLGFFNNGCGVVGFADPDAVGGVISCGSGLPAIRPDDGRIVYLSRDTNALYAFVADVIDEVDDSCRVLFFPSANDERLATPACDDDEFVSRVDDFRLLPGGGYAYRCLIGAAWYDDDGRALPALTGFRVVAFNTAGDALVFTNEEPPTAWSLVRASGEVVPVSGIPPDAAPFHSELSTRAAGRSFRVPVAPSNLEAALYRVDDSGHAEHAFDWVVDGFVDFRDARLGADDSLYVVKSNGPQPEVLRLLPNAGGFDLVFRDNEGGVQLRQMITGP